MGAGIIRRLSRMRRRLERSGSSLDPWCSRASERRKACSLKRREVRSCSEQTWLSFAQKVKEQDLAPSLSAIVTNPSVWD